MKRRLMTARRPERKTERNKLNNAGMSLVEVIVAITILSVVVVPVMHSLTTAAYYNLRARNRQNVTFTAESLMEAFKGYDLLDSENFSVGSDTPAEADNDTLVWLFSGNTDSNEKLKEMLGANELGSVGYSFSGEQPQNAEFTISGLKAEDGKTYYVSIKATPRKEQEDIFELENFSDKTDAVFIGSPAREEALLNDIKACFLDDYCKKEDSSKNLFWKALKEEDIRGDALSEEEIAADLDGHLKVKSRELTFVIGDSNDDGVYDVKCEVVYKYGINEFPCHVEIEDTDDNHSTEDTGEGENSSADVDIEKNPEEGLVPPVGNYEIKNVTINGFDDLKTVADSEITGSFIQQKDTSKNFERLFIYYYPEYKLSSAGWDGGFSDNIIIKDDEADIGFQCYLIKQKATDLGVATLKIRDQSYRPTVGAVVKNNSPKIYLYHNLNENLGGGTGELSYVIKSGSFLKNDEYNSKAMTKKKKVLVYSLLIEIRENDENGKVISSLDGSMNERLVNIS